MISFISSHPLKSRVLSGTAFMSAFITFSILDLFTFSHENSVCLLGWRGKIYMCLMEREMLLVRLKRERERDLYYSQFADCRSLTRSDLSQIENSVQFSQSPAIAVGRFKLD